MRANITQISGDLKDARIFFGQVASGAYANIVAPMHSPSPTLIIDFPALDLELTNMEITVNVTLFATVESHGAPISAAGINAASDSCPGWASRAQERARGGARRRRCATRRL